MKKESISTKRYTLVFTIQSLFLFICILLAGLLITFNFVKGRESAVSNAKKLLEEISHKSVIELRDTLDRPARIVKFLPSVDHLRDKPNGLEHPVRTLFSTLLNNNDKIHSIYIGWDDGDMYQMIRLVKGESFTQELGAPEGAEYYLRYVHERQGHRTTLYGFFNKDHVQLAPARTKPSTYDPRTRPWYIEARQFPDAIHTLFLYRFNTPAVLGTTFMSAFDTGVVGVDIRLDTLVQFLEEHAPGSEGRLIVYDTNGVVTAHDEIDPESLKPGSNPSNTTFKALASATADTPLFSTIFAQFTKLNTPGKAFTFEFDTTRYIASVSVESLIDEEKIVAVVAPEEYFTQEIRKLRMHNLLYTGTIFCLSLFMVILISRRIAKPLNTLAHKADEIKNFNLDTPIDIHSRIKEVADLSLAISNMKQGIQTFSQYIPSDLVRRYIASGASPVIGGDRRTLTVLFSDIADFTTTAETLPPEAVIFMLSDYFSQLGQEVTAQGGTIDKYIGDALMAFWNAPKQTTNHTLSACEATLRCARSVKGYTHSMPHNRTIHLHTRFGLHRGEAVVGNMGSSDRLNFTALGSTINIASRIEGLNKHYGTTILASDPVQAHSKAYFVFRSVDTVLPKGARTPFRIHELIGARPESGLTDLVPSPETMGCLDIWEKAYTAYHARKWQTALELLQSIESPDALATLYIKRTQANLDNNPPEDWDGIERFTEK
ncbi:hypothetical protein GO013_05735 [Pseudodesulfovibrio sp. JC047]|uniref:adenylate/guanylate cyclase domain-containing protein n=1 Tax=Pseudodesulfovibrio sp. JC047 TaxID=2683199 RepID=UPI0013D5636D|nr:adenylate/guanylate cyclase domain-containing protein [Pseudodesulfovibrio sp. JC047]NDV18919.1 hypothetical protein [Pseudodesulfovibrio sp. JC047]